MATSLAAIRHNQNVAGYSGTPLPKKLGIKEGMTVAILGEPEGFREALGEIPVGVLLVQELQPCDIFIVFSLRASEMESQFHTAMAQLPPDGAIWVAWPKKSSGIETDMTEDTMREMFLPSGMVDNKVCAIDDTWSGLRFVVRKENRASWKTIS
jgi:hypothetical protein